VWVCVCEREREREREGEGTIHNFIVINLSSFGKLVRSQEMFYTLEIR